MDITDIIGRGGVFTTHTEYRSTKGLVGVKEIGAEDIFNLAKRATEFDEKSLHTRAVFNAREAESTRILVTSPIPITDLDLFGKKLGGKNVLADGFFLPFKFFRFLSHPS